MKVFQQLYRYIFIYIYQEYKMVEMCKVIYRFATFNSFDFTIVLLGKEKSIYFYQQNMENQLQFFSEFQESNKAYIQFIKLSLQN